MTITYPTVTTSELLKYMRESYIAGFCQGRDSVPGEWQENAFFDQWVAEQTLPLGGEAPPIGYDVILDITRRAMMLLTNGQEDNAKTYYAFLQQLEFAYPQATKLINERYPTGDQKT